MLIASNETDLTKKDVFRMQKLSILKSSWMVVIFAVAFVLLAFRIQNGQFVFESVFFVVLGAITLPLYFVVVKLLMAKQNKRIPELTKYVYNFFDDHIDVEASSGGMSEKLTVRLSDIKGYKSSKNRFLLVIDKNITLFINKSGFKDTTDQTRLEKLFELKIVKKKN